MHFQQKLAMQRQVASAFREMGESGVDWTTGASDGEFLPELEGTRSIPIYREMRDNDSIIGSFIFAIEMIVRGLTWKVKPANDSKKAKKVAMLVQTSLHDMVGYTWSTFLAEMLSMLWFGWGYHEIVYKLCNGTSDDPYLSSKYEDGLIRWKYLPLRAQTNFVEWTRQKDSDNVTGCTFRTSVGGKDVTIPRSKAILFRPSSYLNSPFGRSVLRNAYRTWYQKKRVEEFELIGLERDLAGYPVLQPPESYNIWDTTDPEMVTMLAKAKTFVQNVRRNQRQGAVIPFGWEFKLLSSPSARKQETNNIIERLDHRISSVVAGTFVLMGFQSVGSFALSGNMLDLFKRAVEAWVQVFVEDFTDQAIVPLVEINGFSKDLTPTLMPSRVREIDLGPISAYVNMLSNAGFRVWNDKELENHLRDVADFPPSTESAPPTDVKPSPDDDMKDKDDGET